MIKISGPPRFGMAKGSWGWTRLQNNKQEIGALEKAFLDGLGYGMNESGEETNLSNLLERGSISFGVKDRPNLRGDGYQPEGGAKIVRSICLR